MKKIKQAWANAGQVAQYLNVSTSASPSSSVSYTGSTIGVGQ